MARIVTNAPATLSVTFTEPDETPISADGNVTVTVTDAEGTVLVSNQTATETASGSGIYERALSAISTPTTITAAWSGTFGGAAVTTTTTTEVVSDRLATVAQVRALEGLDDTTVFPTATLEEAIDFAEELIDDYCGSMFVQRLAVVSRPKTTAYRTSILLDRPFVQSLEWVQVDGVDATASYELVDDRLYATSGYIATDPMVYAYVHGPSSAPSGIRWAARTIARHYALNLVSRIPDRALSIQSDFGQVQMAQAGGMQRPTAFPEVNAELNRHRVDAGLIG